MEVILLERVEKLGKIGDVVTVKDGFARNFLLPRGLHQVRVQLHPEVAVMLKVNVARSPEEAELQSQGVDVMASMFERDEAGFTEDYDPNAEPGEIIVDEPVVVGAA